VRRAVAASPWLSRPWRRAAWITLCAVGAARLAAGTVLPMELILALAAGMTVGAGVLVTLGVPDRRIGPDGIAAALRSADLPVSSVIPADVEAKGSRPFFAVADDGRRLFIKALGSDQRDADLLYRAYRFALLRRGCRAQRPGWSCRPRDPNGHLLRVGEPQPGPRHAAQQVRGVAR